MTDVEKELLQLVKIFAILWDCDESTVCAHVYYKLKIKTFKGDENAQKLGICYLNSLLMEEKQNE